MSSINFFKLENELPVLTEEARTIREFRAIIARDKGSEGDADGRRKKQAIKELAFVYWACDWRSVFKRNYSDDARYDVIKKRLDLPEDWRPDALVDAAMMYYVFEQETASLKALQEAEAGLFSAQKLIGLVRKRMDKRIQRLEKQEEESEEESDISSEDVDKIYTDYQRLIKISVELPTQIKSITAMQETVKKEMAEESKGRKGRTVSSHQI